MQHQCIVQVVEAVSLQQPLDEYAVIRLKSASVYSGDYMSGALDTHVLPNSAPSPPLPTRLVELLPDLTQRLSAAGAAAAAAAVQADGEDVGQGGLHGGDVFGAEGWAGEEGDLSEDDGAAIVQALLAPPSLAWVPSPLCLTHLDVSGARGAGFAAITGLLANHSIPAISTEA
eukprot:720683-Pelagomonas_calceolata.AAC.6